VTASAPLPLYEEILLLALDDDKGTTPTGNLFVNAMGGAMLAELVLLGAVRVAHDKKKRVTASPTARIDDPLLSEAWQLIRAAAKPKSAQDWVLKFAGLKDLKNRAARQLVAKQVLKEETGTVLKIFKRTIYPEVDGGPERALIRRLERAIFSDTPDVDQRTVIIVALAAATRLLEQAFDKKKLKTRKKRLERLASGQLVGEATREAIAAIETAIMVCTMVPIITAAT
jgi:hypothetical protein